MSVIRIGHTGREEYQNKYNNRIFTRNNNKSNNNNTKQKSNIKNEYENNPYLTGLSDQDRNIVHIVENNI